MDLSEFFKKGYQLTSHEQKEICKELESKLLAMSLQEQKIHCKSIAAEIRRLREDIFKQPYDQMMFANHLVDVVYNVSRDWPFEYEVGDIVMVSISSKRKIKGRVTGFEIEPFRLINIQPIDNVYKEIFGISECGVYPLSVENESEVENIKNVAAVRNKFEQLSLF